MVISTYQIKFLNGGLIIEIAVQTKGGGITNNFVG